MTALIIGNKEILKTFIVNGYDETVIVNQTIHLHLLDYITTHFIRKDEDPKISGEFLIPRHKGDVIYCSRIDVESIWSWDDRERGVKNVHSFQMPCVPSYPTLDAIGRETRPSTEFIALCYFLQNGYQVNVIGLSQTENSNYDFEKHFLQEKIAEGKVKVI